MPRRARRTSHRKKNHNLSKVQPSTQERLRNRLNKVDKVNQQKGTPQKTLCLTMIVKNESARMVRCLDSTLPTIDYLSICDTGSTDSTVSVIQDWLKKHPSIKGKVHQTEFRNFSYARTLSVQKAKESFPSASYFLLLDADMVLEVTDRFKKNLLFEDKYLVTQYNSHLSYVNLRLLVNSSEFDWKCYGVTHEFWDMDQEAPLNRRLSSHTLTSLKIKDLGDGGAKDDKFERDEQLLLSGIFEEKIKPASLQKRLITRYTFYLAQTYKDTQQYWSAIYWYFQRIHRTANSFLDEVYLSYHYIGLNWQRIYFLTDYPASDQFTLYYNRSLYRSLVLENQTHPLIEQAQIPLRELSPYSADSLPSPQDYDWNRTADSTLDSAEISELAEIYFKVAKKYLLEAFLFLKRNGMPLRRESLYELIKMNRVRSQHQEAYKYIQLASKIEKPPPETLFSSDPLYEYLVDYELSIVAYYLPEHRDEGRIACEKLLAWEGLPAHYRQLVQQNCKFYL